MVSPRRLPLVDRLAFLFFLLLLLVLAFLGIDRSCLDAADSAYMVSSDAIARGLIPYKDFLLAHPPLLFVVGAPLALLGWGSIPFRIFSILVLAGLGLTVWRLALRITANTGIAMLAGALTLFAPLGLYFSKLFINDPLVSLLTALIFLLLFGRSRAAMAGAGVLSVLATLTKLTWLPVLVVCSVYVIIFRRKQGWIYLAVALGGSVAAGLLVQLVTDGAYLGDIFASQASKGYSFSNFFQGLRRIWSMDWPLIVPAVVGTWFAVRAIMRREQLSPGLRGRLFLLAGWLISGLALLGTLPAEGHDTNLFLLAEPVLAIMAAWGIMGLAERRTVLAVAAVGVWLVLAVPALVDRDRDYLFRSNNADVAVIVSEIQGRSTECQAVLVPGCFAVEADRPVTDDFFDQFLWEEKYKRGDEDAVELFDKLKRDLAAGVPPVVVFGEEQATRKIVAGELSLGYQTDYTSKDWPPLQMYSPKEATGPG